MTKSHIFFERQLMHKLVHHLAKSDLFGGLVYLSAIHLSICLFENATTFCIYKDLFVEQT